MSSPSCLTHALLLILVWNQSARLFVCVYVGTLTQARTKEECSSRLEASQMRQDGSSLTLTLRESFFLFQALMIQFNKIKCPKEKKGGAVGGGVGN